MMATVAGNPAATHYVSSTPNLFLLDPGANRKFVTGEATRIGSSRIMLLLALLFFLIGAGAIGYVVYGELNAQALEREGTTTNAIIVDGHSTTSTRSGTSYYITYELTVNKQKYRRDVQIAESLYDQLRIGSAVSVRYLMRDPNINMLWGDDFDMTAVNSQRAIGAIVGASGLVIALICMWIDGRNRRISTGTLLRGTVTGAKAQNGRKGTYLVTINYTFTTPSGGIINKKAQGNRPDLRRSGLPTIGTPIAVLYVNDRTVRLM
jgi:hypothetical protein